MWEPIRILARAPDLFRLAPGSGAPVMAIPGFSAPEASMAPLCAYLRVLGYDARGWGMGINRGGHPDKLAEVLQPRVAALAKRVGHPVHLVGWSLGGVIARELARQDRTSVASVVTLGSPVIGGPIYTAVASRYDDDEKQRILTRIEETYKAKIGVPITVIYSRADGVVSWLACLDHDEPLAHHEEVEATHTGLVLNPDVWMRVARHLAKVGTR